jgi:hypothetical protein
MANRLNVGQRSRTFSEESELKRLASSLNFFCLMLVAHIAYAFEQPTHRIMSEHAALHSVLATQPATLSDLGLGNMTVQSLDGETIYQWIGDGAEFEDNLEWPLIRPKNHFYNPLTGQGLSTTLLGFNITGEPSPSWGLEDDRQEPDQLYSFKHAREYFYKGFTELDKVTREHNLAMMFRSMGQIIHLVQDAAQPQHTRNDAHILGFNTSLYETITNDERDTLPYEGYASPVFNNARTYWHSQPPSNQGGNILQGQGMAEYSNRNFVSAGTNFRFYAPYVNLIIPDQNFGLPLIDKDASGNEIYQPVDITTLLPTSNLQGFVYFYQTTITEPNATPVPNTRATTLSIFDDELKNYLAPQGTRGLFTLNRFNFEAANQFLIPRAVGHSAGLINYFFRGRIAPVDAVFFGTNVTLRVQNLTQDETIFAGGALIVSFEYTYNAQTIVGKTSTAVLTENIPSQATSTSSYTFMLDAPIPNQATNFRAYLVFQGKLGEETGAVAATMFSGQFICPDFPFVPRDTFSWGKECFDLIDASAKIVQKPRIPSSVSQGGFPRNMFAFRTDEHYYGPSGFTPIPLALLTSDIAGLDPNRNFPNMKGLIAFHPFATVSYATAGEAIAALNNLHPGAQILSYRYEETWDQAQTAIGGIRFALADAPYTKFIEMARVSDSIGNVGGFNRIMGIQVDETRGFLYAVLGPSSFSTNNNTAYIAKLDLNNLQAGWTIFSSSVTLGPGLPTLFMDGVIRIGGDGSVAFLDNTRTHIFILKDNIIYQASRNNPGPPLWFDGGWCFNSVVGGTQMMLKWDLASNTYKRVGTNSLYTPKGDPIGYAGDFSWNDGFFVEVSNFPEAGQYSYLKIFLDKKDANDPGVLRYKWEYTVGPNYWWVSQNYGDSITRDSLIGTQFSGSGIRKVLLRDIVHQ